MGNRLGRRRRRRDESEDSPDEEGGFRKEKTEKRQIKIPQMKEQRMSTKAGPILGQSQLGQL